MGMMIGIMLIRLTIDMALKAATIYMCAYVGRKGWEAARKK